MMVAPTRDTTSIVDHLVAGGEAYIPTTEDHTIAATIRSIMAYGLSLTIQPIHASPLLEVSIPIDELIHSTWSYLGIFFEEGIDIIYRQCTLPNDMIAALVKLCEGYLNRLEPSDTIFADIDCMRLGIINCNFHNRFQTKKNVLDQWNHLRDTFIEKYT